MEQNEIEFDIAVEAIENEKRVYQRLGKHHSIVDCLDISGVGVQLALMEHGNLQDYLKQNQPSASILLGWFRDMAQALVHIHDRRVIVADIATRNFLVDVNRSVKMSDFSESSILPLSTDMQTADDSGYSIYTDIGQLGTVIYEAVTRQPCSFDLFKGQPPGPATATWPHRTDLPTTDNIWLGSIIERCWTKGALRDARELSAVLDSFTMD